MKFTNQYSIVSPVKTQLNDLLFDKEKLKDLVRNKILNIVKKISHKYNLEIRYTWIIGSSIGYQYEDYSDIDINISAPNIKSNDKLLEINKDISSSFNEKYYIGNHPINFTVINKPYSWSKTDAIYNLIANHWIRKPNKLSETEIKNLIKFCKNDQLLNNIFSEYATLEQLLKQYSESGSRKDIAIDILNSTKQIINIFSNIKDRRREKFKQKSKTPINRSCENVVYKMIESYGLDKLYLKFKNIVEEKIEPN